MSITIRPFALSDEDAVVALWHEAGLTRPWNDPHADIRRKLTVQPELFLVAVDTPGGGDEADPAVADDAAPDRAATDTAQTIVGSVMAGYDGHRGWLSYLAAASSHRGRGIGRALVAEAERLLLERGCPKVQLMVRPDNAAARGFYDALGYEPFETWTTGKRLIVDGPAAPD
ncbi:GNAT family N-acetyltransferase [Microbacterium testaceum]|uniref:GNAT family N-acetyltransferase n=1 Tax=Microbacterium testaceum TaxID=2033 RepID=UPI0022E000C7|nr:GNAT family N-acetyltransferase [Microbacterium testaceum]